MVLFVLVWVFGWWIRKVALGDSPVDCRNRRGLPAGEQIHHPPPEKDQSKWIGLFHLNFPDRVSEIPPWYQLRSDLINRQHFSAEREKRNCHVTEYLAITQKQTAHLGSVPFILFRSSVLLQEYAAARDRILL